MNTNKAKFIGNDRDTSIVLAALRHFQNSIDAGEDLSYLLDIVDLDSFDHHDEINALCEAINCEDEYHEYQFQMTDWRLSEGTAVTQEGDDQPFSVKSVIGNQTRFDITDATGEPCIGLQIEINHGVPAIVIDTLGGDPLLHIHATSEGLVLTPNDNDTRFESAEVNRYSFNDPSSLLIRHN